jgi:hypothetical protein
MISAWIGVDVLYLYHTKLTFGELVPSRMVGLHPHS